MKHLQPIITRARQGLPPLNRRRKERTYECIVVTVGVIALVAIWIIANIYQLS